MSEDGYRRLSAAIVIEAFQDATGMKLEHDGYVATTQRVEASSGGQSVPGIGQAGHVV